MVSLKGDALPEEDSEAVDVKLNSDAMVNADGRAFLAGGLTDLIGEEPPENAKEGERVGR